MDQIKIINWLKRNDIQFIENFDLSKKSWLKSGGEARIFIQPNDLSKLLNLIKFFNEDKIDFLPVGNLTNSLFREGEIVTPFINLKNINDNISLVNETDSNITLKVGAGVSIFKYVNYLQNQFRISGQEGLIGIPGTVGAAIITNASSYESCISTYLDKVEFIDHNGEIFQEKKESLNLGWRNSKFLLMKNFIITNLFFDFDKKYVVTNETIDLKVKKIKAHRDKFQEKKYPNLGSLYATKNLYYDLSKISFNLFLLYCFYIICTKLIFLFLNDKYLLSFRKFIVKLYLSYFKIDQNKFSLSERTINCLVNKGSKNSKHAFKLIDKLEKKIKGKVKLENKIFRNIR